MKAPLQIKSTCLIFFFTSLFLSCSQTQVIHLNQNNLGQETSLYLLQHAENPVHWQPWNETRFVEQNKAEKLLIVSIGYSSCHWCHVMEEETFEDERVAKMMNENFINIKVDREENPDVDHIYMTAVQLLTGRGGWPLNVICLPDGTPIYGGTYHTQTQWVQILERVQERYSQNPEQLLVLAKKIKAGITAVNLIEVPENPKPFTASFFEKPMASWQQKFDLVYGGELQEQKFIRPAKLHFLRQYQSLAKDARLKSYLENSLKKIATGGLFDALEGGFFRYSVDPYWKVPHFEKMLYDNAQALGLYAEAYKQNPLALYKQTVEETMAFLDQRMVSQKGGYYAAIDADNEEGEGRYYAFTRNEINELAADQIKLFTAYYGVEWDDPFEEELYLLKKNELDESFVKENGLKTAFWNDVKKQWETNIKKIVSERNFPGVDTKIITSWNALTVNGMLSAAEAFEREDWLQKAESLFNFLIENVWIDQKLYHTLQNNRPKVEGFLEDYAFLAKAALELYKTTGAEKYLNWSKTLTEEGIANFEDPNSPFFIFKSKNQLLSPIIAVDDGVMPSANAVMAQTLSDLGHLLNRKEYLELAEKMLQTIQPYLEESISDYSCWAMLYAQWAYPQYEIIIVGSKADMLTKEIKKRYLPNVLFQQSQNPSDLPLLKERFFEGETYIYVCQNNVCLRPETTVEKAIKQLEEFENQAIIPDPSNSFF